jgi:hypothetical protein
MAGVEESGDHASGQLRLGRELRIVTEAGGPAAVGIGTRNIEFPVHCGVPAAAGVDQVDGDLGVLDPAPGAGVLPLDSNGVGAFLHVAGLVNHQRRLVVVQMLHHVVTHLVADLVGIPLRPPEQVLHAVRGPDPAHSAMVQQFLRGRSDNRPSTNFRARRRDSTRVKRPAIRLIRPSNASC